jgi:hypothetical protein
MDTDYPGISSQIEGFTGARQVYGIDTPINILDIIDNVSLTVGLLALSYADAQVVCENIAIACLRGNMDPWFVGDTRLSNLLDDAEMYLNTKDTPGTPKLDSCGDPVPGFYGVIPVGKLTDEVNSIVASAGALDLTTGVVYSQSYWLLQSSPYSPAQVAYWQAQAILGGYTIDLTGLNTIDPVNNTAQTIPDYSDTPISELSTNPNLFFNDSATFDAQTPSGTQYGLLIHQPINQSGAPPVSYTNTAVQMLVDALGQLILMLTQNVNLLTGIVSETQDYMLQYATEQRLRMGPEISRLNEIGITGIFPMPTNDPNNAVDEQLIINAGLNERNNLLHDSTYITSFSSNAINDTDPNATLTAQDRANLENAVRAQMKAVRLSTAAALQASLQAQYDALDQLSSDARIINLITPYLL